MNRRIVLLLAASALHAPLELAAQVPLPLPRPVVAASAGPCTELLAAGIAMAELEGAVSGVSGDAFCGDEAPVRLRAIRLGDGRSVEVRPAALVRCETALAFARWVRDELAPTVALAEAPLERIEVAASYSCRPRNNVAGARLSEHGRANAIDVGAIAFTDGRGIALGDADAPAILLAAMRWSACARFTTVLGPGADPAHERHVHLDLARRRGGFRLCQWTLPEWPEP